MYTSHLFFFLTRTAGCCFGIASLARSSVPLPTRSKDRLHKSPPFYTGNLSKFCFVSTPTILLYCAVALFSSLLKFACRLLFLSCCFFHVSAHTHQFPTCFGSRVCVCVLPTAIVPGKQGSHRRRQGQPGAGRACRRSAHHLPSAIDTRVCTYACMPCTCTLCFCVLHGRLGIMMHSRYHYFFVDAAVDTSLPLFSASEIRTSQKVSI